MPDTNQNNNASVPNISAAPTGPMSQLLNSIKSSDSILIALPQNPSVDILTAAIALTLFLDKYGKHATAIFSGDIPNTIAFLQPEKTFESSIDSLQDFIISLNKNKADHLRYKIEGDFVKVYISPYKTKISESDLEFDYGNFNVDLVITLNIAKHADLDAALAEHSSAISGLKTVNISANQAKSASQTDWNDSVASSISEMIFKLIKNLSGEEKLIDASIANALLTGIITATERFSNQKTTPNTMSIAAELMQFGADQQLIANSISMGASAKPKIQNTNTHQASVETSPVQSDQVNLNADQSIKLNDMHNLNNAPSYSFAEDNNPEPITQPLPVAATEDIPAFIRPPQAPSPAPAVNSPITSFNPAPSSTANAPIISPNPTAMPAGITPPSPVTSTSVTPPSTTPITNPSSISTDVVAPTAAPTANPIPTPVADINPPVTTPTASPNPTTATDVSPTLPTPPSNTEALDSLLPPPPPPIASDAELAMPPANLPEDLASDDISAFHIPGIEPDAS